MFWDDASDSNETQVLKNLIFMKMPVTNAERDSFSPVFLIVIVVVVVLVVIFSVKG
jgi:hypothetical protein